MSFARTTVSAERKTLSLLRSLFTPSTYHNKQQLLLRSRCTATLNLSAMDNSHFRVDYGLLWASMSLKEPHTIRHMCLTACRDVITFSIRLDTWQVFVIRCYEQKSQCPLTATHDSVEIPTRCSFVIEFTIPKFFKGSTCFERHTVHHQEL